VPLRLPRRDPRSAVTPTLPAVARAPGWLPGILLELVLYSVAAPGPRLQTAPERNRPFCALDRAGAWVACKACLGGARLWLACGGPVVPGAGLGFCSAAPSCRCVMEHRDGLALP